jgi:glycosyltransferase involved in cell wall biosynthesis
VRPVIVVPDSTDSRQLFSGIEGEIVHLKMRRARLTWNVWTHATFFLSLPATLLALRRLIRRKNVDLVHFNEITDFIAGVAAKSCGVPCVCHVRADGLPNPYRWLLLATLNRVANTVVVPSKSTGAWLVAGAPTLSGKIRLIYDYAFDVREYEKEPSGADLRRELGIGPNDVLVLLVSKLLVWKGHLVFIRAAEQVFKTAPNTHFAIVGGAVSGHEREEAEIRALAQELLPGRPFHFVGPRSDLAHVYAASDIAVHCPIYPDPYPTVVLLGMLAGKPVIGTEIGGIPEQIENGRTGVLVPPADPAALADAILRLAQDAARRSRLGSAAREEIKINFAPARQGQLLTELYERAIQSKIKEGSLES